MASLTSSGGDAGGWFIVRYPCSSSNLPNLYHPFTSSGRLKEVIQLTIAELRPIIRRVCVPQNIKTFQKK